jgi:hypothetical protein
VTNTPWTTSSPTSRPRADARGGTDGPWHPPPREYLNQGARGTQPQWSTTLPHAAAGPRRLRSLRARDKVGATPRRPIDQYSSLRTSSTIRVCGAPASAGAARPEPQRSWSAARKASASRRLSKVEIDLDVARVVERSEHPIPLDARLLAPHRVRLERLRPDLEVADRMFDLQRRHRFSLSLLDCE